MSDVTNKLVSFKSKSPTPTIGYEMMDSKEETKRGDSDTQSCSV